MCLSAKSLGAAGLAGEAAGGGMVADMALGLVVVHSDPDRLACPNVHHILALGFHVSSRISGAVSPKSNASAQCNLPSCSI